MNKLFPLMYDGPENGQSVAGVSYSTIPFLVLPFTLMLLTIGSNSTRVYTGIEYVYQLINFAAVFFIYRTYLQDSWMNVSLAPSEVLTVSAIAASCIAVIYIGTSFAAYLELYPKANTVFFGILPMTGIELTMLPGDLVLFGGIPAVLLLVVLGPVITSCLFYASAFAPLCVAGKRFWAYVSVAAMLAAPRIVTYFCVWGGWKEVALYLTQLPIHFLACWAYQKADTIWAPIFTHAMANAFSCVMLYTLHFAGIIG